MTTLALLLNIVLNAVFIPVFGFIAAAYTTLISYLILLVMHWIGYRKGISAPMYDLKLLCGISAVTVIACLLCGLTYETRILRYGIVAVLLVIAFLKRRDILARFRELKK